MRTETFQTVEPPRLRINLAAGDVELETADTGETRVELEGPGEDEAVIELRGNEVVVDVERKRRLGRGREHRLSILAPDGASVEATLASADLKGNGRFGDVRATTASGDVIFQEIGGEARAKTASGDVIVKSVGAGASIDTASGDVIVKTLSGEATIRSASGDVVVGEAEAGLRVQTASGDQKIGSVAQGEVTLQSASGDLEVGVRRGSTLWVDARSMSGDTTSELDLGDGPTEDGGPHVELRATAMSGDIRIKRA